MPKGKDTSITRAPTTDVVTSRSEPDTPRSPQPAPAHREAVIVARRTAKSPREFVVGRSRRAAAEARGASTTTES